jgi:hypothetical protein
MCLIALKNGAMRLGGVRLSPETMDKIAKWWIDQRRVCMFCKEPGMNADVDEQPHFENVQTVWTCEHCGAEMETIWEPDEVPWEDPLEGTR